MEATSLDMSLFFGTPEQKKEFSSQLLQNLKTRGVVKIKNHSIPESQIARLFELVRSATKMVFDFMLIPNTDPPVLCTPL